MRNKAGALIALLALSVPAAVQAEDQYKLLVLAIPNKYHYEYIPIARDSLEHLGKLHDFSFTWANNTSVFDGDLSQYAAVMFLNTPGEELNPAQRARFEAIFGRAAERRDKSVDHCFVFGGQRDRHRRDIVLPLFERSGPANDTVDEFVVQGPSDCKLSWAKTAS